ncbi:MAG TPA: GNAT family N-acetyltransferase [Anaerolineae bacterium]|nr:GNAT family N-acetyltransferase [Anaerolineae bacterium]
MLHELKQPRDRVLGMDCAFPEALAIIEGNNPGWVFVDDLTTPNAALVWAQGITGFYLVGDAESAVFLEELGIYTDRVLGPRLRSLGVAWFEVSGDENWNAVIRRVFGERNLESSQQWVYTLQPRGHKSVTQRKVSGDYELLRVDQRLLDDLLLRNKKFLFSKLMRFWASVDTFLNTGLGYVLVDGGEIASLCCSGFVTGNVHVIDVETEVSHRRKGYAGIVARAFVTECIEKDLQPHWDCMAENTASARLAEKLGFTQSHAYTLYSFPLQT